MPGIGWVSGEVITRGIARTACDLNRAVSHINRHTEETLAAHIDEIVEFEPGPSEIIVF
jgi:hypothetical protein